MSLLDPARLDLHGLQLIEASAGTGKTYTITGLYLRLLLERDLGPERILVVTYTEAATQELRRRIRERLAQALAHLDGLAPAGDRPDTWLDGYLADPRIPQDAAIRLADALARMDEAAVYTIHGFCRRMLQDNAFETGAPFEAELITDEGLLRQAAVEDFWRRRLATLDREGVAWLRARWATPAALLQVLEGTLGLGEVEVLPALDPAAVAAARTALTATFARLRDLWSHRRAEVEAILRSDPALNRRSYSRPVVDKAVAALDRLLAADRLPEALPEHFERCTPAKLAEQTKPGAATPAHPLFDSCGELAEGLARLAADEQALLLAEARWEVRKGVARRKTERRQLYFDDLLQDLAAALAGPGAEPLAALIRQRFPAALIDELQDTDPLQYRIFRRVYAGRGDCALFLIGDPKQAIYAFRGADVFTYMQARSDGLREGALHTLGVNWRSSAALVGAVNVLFGSAENPFLLTPDIVFEPVDPSPEAEQDPLLIDGCPPAPLQWRLLAVTDDNCTKQGQIRADAARELAAAVCAEHVAGLLTLAGEGRATLGDRALQPKDIALLVRTHREGDLLQQALRRRGIASVTLSQASVLAGEDAAELAILLAAVADPADLGRLRTALAGGLMGWPVSRLAALERDESAWESLTQAFQDYRRAWLEQGFMVAFQRLLREQGVAPRLLAHPDGERRLTNLLQLGELLQVAAAAHPGLDGLLRWLRDARAEDAVDDARQLRLESDEALVKVVTMHKSKGLEYPVVLIPFPWSSGPGREDPLVLYHDRSDRRARLDLGSADQDRARALRDEERLAEALRLFYVAVTRARRLCLLCWGKVNQAERSAPAWLLHRDPEDPAAPSRMGQLDEAGIRADLERLAARLPDAIELSDAGIPGATRWRPPTVAAEDLRAARLGRPVDDRWRVSSYSGLIRGEDSERPDHDRVVPLEETPATAPAEPIFALPGGTRVGHFLHELLEQLDFPSARDQVLRERVQALLRRYGGLTQPGEGAPDWTAVVEELVGNCLDTPLDADGALRLRDIAAADRLNELEFHYPVAELDPRGLGAVLRDFADYAPTAESLSFDPRRGLLRGFIDLVIRHRGRCYLLDYKSNHLGPRLEDYGPEGMRRAVLGHRYDLQYLLYTLALHRWLGRRLADYDYQRHFGGVYYLFLRGMRPARGSAFGVWHDRPAPQLVARLDALLTHGRTAP
jgi:exodeoxyribonuclease V beta subunit